MNISLGDNRTLSYNVGRDVNAQAADVNDGAAVKSADTASVSENAGSLKDPMMKTGIVTDASPIVQSALREAGLELTESNRQLVDMLLGNMMSVDKGSVRQLYNQTKAYPNADAGMLCIMNKNHIPVNAASVSGMEHFLSSETMLFEALEPVFGGLEALMDAQTEAAGSMSGQTAGQLADSMQDNSLMNGQLAEHGTEPVAAQTAGQETEQFTAQLMAQSAGQETEQLTSQFTAQSAGQGAEQAAEQFTARSAGQDTALTAAPLTAQSAGQDTAQAAGQPGAQTVGQDTALAAGQPGAQTVGQDTALAAGQPGAQTVGQDTAQAAGQPGAQTVGQNTVLTAAQSAGQETAQTAGTQPQPSHGVSAKEALRQYVMDISSRDESAAARATGKNEDLKTMVHKLHEKLSLKPDEINRESVKKLYEQISELLKKAGEAADESGMKGLKDSVMQAAKTLEFMKDASDIYPFIEIPVKLKDSEAEAGLYVYSREKGRMIDPKDCTALIHIEMPNLGLLDIRLRLTGSDLSMVFSSEEEASKLLESSIDELKQVLYEKGYSVEPQFEIRSDDQTVEVKEEALQAGSERLTFDVRA